MPHKYFFTFLLLFALTANINCLEKEVTVSIEARSEECFYQNVTEGQIIDIEYQVIDGTHGEIDISFQLLDPTGRVLFADFKKSENGHRTEAVITGDYKFCFDNTFSNFNAKTVFFEIIVEGDGEDRWGNEDAYDDLAASDLEMYDVHIMDSINNLRTNLNKIQHHQENIRAHEARDRNVAEENFFKVNTLSIIQISIMLVVGFVQVIMVKSLFDNTSKAHKIWKGLQS